MMKKILSAVTALFVVGTMALSTYAYDEAEYPIMTTPSYGVMPIYDNVNYVASGIGINSSNKATCSGSYFLYSKKKSVITMTLKKSSNGPTNWTKVESWSQTNNSQSPAGFSKTSTNALSSSYYYCTYVEVKIYDSNNNVIETVSCFSNSTHL